MQNHCSPRFINRLFEDASFHVDAQSIHLIVRDIINMNWWNTNFYLVGYSSGKRKHRDAYEHEKRIAVQLKEYYRIRAEAIKDECLLRHELAGYIQGSTNFLRQLNVWSQRSRANPSQFFTKNGEMTWIDCTSRATYAWKYVCQNGFIDFDGIARFSGANDVISKTTDIGVNHYFQEGIPQCKSEILSQRKYQMMIAEWIEKLKINVLDEKKWLFDLIKEVRTDPFKNWEYEQVKLGLARGVNESLYGFYHHRTSKIIASAASRASNASGASNVSHASDAGSTFTDSSSWSQCKYAIQKPEGLEYPKVFRKNIFALAGSWKINKELALSSKIAWFDPFMGHGTSPLFAKRYGINYLGFDTNERAFKEYLHFVQDAISGPGSNVEIRLQDSTQFIADLVEKFDLCYTSPPYFNFEEYGGNTAHFDKFKTYEEFLERLIKPVLENVKKYLIQDGILALQTEKNNQRKKQWISCAESCGFKLLETKTTGYESFYSKMAKKDQNLLIFKN